MPVAAREEQDSQTLCYVDDETEQVRDACPVRLQTRTQERVDVMTTWLGDNRMVVSPAKTKLILSVTKELRHKRLLNLDFTITVSG